LCILINNETYFLVIQVHTKKRNRLAQSHLNDLVFVKANCAFRHRCEETMDLILLKDIDESNEWLLGRMDGDLNDDTFVFQDDNLT